MPWLLLSRTRIQPPGPYWGPATPSSPALGRFAIGHVLPPTPCGTADPMAPCGSPTTDWSHRPSESLSGPGRTWFLCSPLCWVGKAPHHEKKEIRSFLHPSTMAECLGRARKAFCPPLACPPTSPSQPRGWKECGEERWELLLGPADPIYFVPGSRR